MLLYIRDRVRVGFWQETTEWKARSAAGRQRVLPADTHIHTTFRLFYSHYRNPLAVSCGFAVAPGRKMLQRKPQSVVVWWICRWFWWATCTPLLITKLDCVKKTKKQNKVEAKEESERRKKYKKKKPKRQKNRVWGRCVWRNILTLFFPLTVHFSTSFVFQVSFWKTNRQPTVSSKTSCFLNHPSFLLLPNRSSAITRQLWWKSH